MTLAGVVILIGYAALISAPYVFRRFGKAGTDQYGAFAAGARDFGWFRIAAGLSATYIGGAAILNTASLGYTFGWYALADVFPTVLGLLLSAVMVVPLILKNRMLSVGGLLQGSGPLTNITAGLLATVVYTLVTAAQIVALLRILHPYFAIPDVFLATIATIGIAAYICYGGYSAVTVTDVIQFAVMILCYFALAWAVLLFSPLNSSTPAVATRPMPLDLMLLLALPLLFVPVSQDLHVRVNSASSHMHARMGVAVAGIAYLVLGTTSATVGYSLANQGVQLTSGDNAVPFFIQEHFGAFAVIPSLAVIAAIVSTLDSVLFAAATSLSYDVIDKFSAHPRQKDSPMPRVATCCILAIALIIALRAPSILSLILSALVIYVSVLLPMLVGIGLGFPAVWTGRFGLVALLAILILEITGYQPPYRVFVYCAAHLAALGSVGLWLRRKRRGVS